MKPLHLGVSILFLVAAVWVITLSEKTVRSIQATYHDLTLPLQTVGTTNYEFKKRFLEEVKTSQELEARLKSMESEFGRLQATEARYKQIEKENNQFRESLEFKKRSEFNLVSAKVIKRNPSSWWETVQIDKGEEDGIGVQIPIVTDRGLLGKVDQVWGKNATILLITDESCQVSAKVDGSAELGIISGLRGSFQDDPELILNYLSKDFKAPIGAKVLTTGKGGVFPDNILIGTIVSIKNGEYSSKAVVKPSVNFSETDIVFAIKNLKND